jgi:acetyltransferase
MAEPPAPIAEEQHRLRDGRAVILRSLGDGDERRLQDLLDHMSLADIRHRFFVPIRELGPALSRHLSHPDPERELALAAHLPEEEAILGVARLAADETRRRAEFALAVRTDWKGHGLGRLLLRRLLEGAAARDLAELWGDVQRDNDAMLGLCRKLGFAIAEHPAEGDLLRVTKRLAPPAREKDA